MCVLCDKGNQSLAAGWVATVSSDTARQVVLDRFRFLGRLLAKACRNKSVLPLPLDDAVFAVLCEEDPRQILKAFTAPSPESRLGYEQKKLKTSKEPFSRYDILNVFFTICDEVEAVQLDRKVSDSDRTAKLAEISNRKISDGVGGWLATIPRAFEWYLQSNEGATTQSVLQMLTIEDDSTCYTWLELVGFNSTPGLVEFGKVTVENVCEFGQLLLAAFESAVKPQLQALRAGIEDVLPVASLEKFYPSELNELFCGSSTPGWTAESLLDKVFYFVKGVGLQPYTKSDPGIQALAAAVDEFSSEQQSQFLEYVTGKLDNHQYLTDNSKFDLI